MALAPGGNKAKGASGERELAGLLEGYSALVGVQLNLVRNLEQTRDGGHDIIGLEAYKLAVEVKRVEVLAVSVWWRQAVQSAERLGFDPVLAYRQNRKPWRFRIRGWVYPCQKPLTVDLTDDQFVLWFQSRLLRVDPNDPLV